MKDILKLIITLIIFLLIYPIFLFGTGYLDGILLKIIIGDPLIKGLNMMFNTSYFTKDMIPLMTGTLACIASFFKPLNSSKSNK